MELLFDLVLKFIVKWFNRINLAISVENWSAFDWMICCVIILILFRFFTRLLKVA